MREPDPSAGPLDGKAGPAKAKQRQPRDAAHARDAALRLLTYRPRSEAELRQRLKDRFPEAAVEETLAGLKEQGLLDDAAFAQEWRRQREQHRPRSQALLRQELRRMGVDDDTIGQALEGFDDGENAYQAGRRRAGRLRLDDYSGFKRKMWGFLQRRGFAGSAAREAVERLWRELSDPEYGDVDGDAQENDTEERYAEGI